MLACSAEYKLHSCVHLKSIVCAIAGKLCVYIIKIQSKYTHISLPYYNILRYIIVSIMSLPMCGAFDTSVIGLLSDAFRTLPVANVCFSSLSNAQV